MEKKDFLSIEDPKFDSAWVYENPVTGAVYRNAVIPGEILFSELKGALNENDIEGITSVLEAALKSNSQSPIH